MKPHHCLTVMHYSSRLAKDLNPSQPPDASEAERRCTHCQIIHQTWRPRANVALRKGPLLLLPPAGRSEPRRTLRARQALRLTSKQDIVPFPGHEGRVCQIRRSGLDEFRPERQFPSERCPTSTEQSNEYRHPTQFSLCGHLEYRSQPESSSLYRLYCCRGGYVWKVLRRSLHHGALRPEAHVVRGTGLSGART